MSQFKRVQVVMLPTETGENFSFLKNVNGRGNQLYKPTKNYYYTKSYLLEQQFQPQHLYIISEDEIKEGDWYIWMGNKVICQASSDLDILNKHLNNSDVKKIIATTDKLSLNNCNTPWTLEHKYVPQPSQQFIEKYFESYNKGEVIIDVLVEYEWYNTKPNSAPIYGKFKEKLKVNPKDNTITIKKLKESWNKEEVKQLLIDCCGEVSCEDGKLVGKEPSELYYWIEKNL